MGSTLHYTMRDILPLLPIEQPPTDRSSYNLPCPVCDQPGKRGRHLNINLERNVFRCPKCGQFEGGVFDLYAWYAGIPRKDVRGALGDKLGSGTSSISSKTAAKYRLQPPNIPQAPLADIEVRDRTYSALLEKLCLEPDHRENLLGRGLSGREIIRLGYRTAPTHGLHALAQSLLDDGYTIYGVPGFYQDGDGSWTVASFLRGIMIPCRDRFGRIQSIHVRLDKKMKKGGKFLTFSSSGKPHGARAENWCHIAGPESEYVFLVEGYMKADIVHYLTTMTVVAVPGVTSLLHLEAVLRELNVKHVVTCFDMDYLKNWHVESAYRRLTELLGGLPFTFSTALWPPDCNGLDDYVWEHVMKRRPME